MLCAGQVYRSTLTVKAQSGAPSTVTLAITKPDGTLVSPAPTPGAGSQVGADWVVTYDYTLPSAGRFVFTWATTGPGTAPYPDVVNVRDPASIVGLGEMKAHLNITGTGSDDELFAFLQAATELVEAKVGPCVRRTYTERVTDARSGAMLLPYKPVLSVTSITSVQPSGPSWGPGDLIVDNDAGIVTTTWAAMRFWWGPWDVVFAVGRAVIAERFIHACKEQVR